MRRGSGVRSLGLFLLLTGLCLGVGAAKPASSSKVERIETNVVLLDVEVSDLSGAPLPGLKAEEFQLRVDGVYRPIYSVDDLCSCPEGSTASVTGSVPSPEAEENAIPETSVSGSVSLTAAGPAAAPVPPAARVPAAAEEMLFVLYLDYSQLQLGGRRRAADAAESWVRDVKRPGERAMVVAYGSSVKVYAEPTADREALIAAVRASYEDPLMTIVLPNQRDPLATRCQIMLDPEQEKQKAIDLDLIRRCVGAAQKELYHAVRSLEALQTVLETLGLHPGRKSLLYFHENGTIAPFPIYGLSPDEFLWRDGELMRDLEEIAVDATESRTKIYTAFVGNTADAGSFYAYNLGMNFSDKTGGRHNRTRDQLPRLLKTAGRESCCLYRVGIRPPRRRMSPRLRWARITTRGLVRPAVRSFRFLGPGERWRRHAMAVLKVPEAHGEIPLAVAIVPRRRNGKRWRVDLLLATRTEALLDVPEGKGGSGDWGVGAYLDTGGRSRRYEGFSSLFVRDLDHQPPFFVYRESVEVRPGHVDLRAYLGRVAGAEFGGARAAIDLPRGDLPGVVGPLLLLGQERQLALRLPAAGSGSKSAPEPALRFGTVPAGLRPIREGDLLLVRSFLCPGKTTGLPERIRRYVSAGGKPLFKLPAERGTVEEGCLEIEDRLPISAAVFPPGEYTYHLEWNWPEEEETKSADRSFRVGP